MVSQAKARTGTMESAIDLRRRHSRDLAEILVERAELALPEDRAMIEAVYRDGVSAERLSRLIGRSPRATRQRIRVVATRLLSSRFIFVMRQRDRWPLDRKRIATACAIHGQSMRKAASSLGYTLHEVRTEMSVVDALESMGGAR